MAAGAVLNFELCFTEIGMICEPLNGTDFHKILTLASSCQPSDNGERRTYILLDCVNELTISAFFSPPATSKRSVAAALRI